MAHSGIDRQGLKEHNKAIGGSMLEVEEHLPDSLHHTQASGQLTERLFP